MRLEDIIKTINIQASIIEEGSKLAYAYEKKNKKSYEKLVTKENGYFEKLEDKKLDLAIVDEKTKAILYNEKGGMQFTKESERELRNFNKQLIKEEYEFEFYKVEYNILTDSEKECISSIDDEEYEILSRFISNIPK
jgi:hypothetical protein